MYFSCLSKYLIVIYYNSTFILQKSVFLKFLGGVLHKYVHLKKFQPSNNRMRRENEYMAG
jgi:hypothetical protein